MFHNLISLNTMTAIIEQALHVHSAWTAWLIVAVVVWVSLRFDNDDE